MQLQHLWLTDFRNYAGLDLELPAGTSVFVGRNGQGKSNLLEAVYFLATMASFRVRSTDALIGHRQDESPAVARGEFVGQGREILVEAALRAGGRPQMQVNRQRVRRRELLGLLPVSIFMPEDLELIKGGPAARRQFLDEALAQMDPRLDGVRSETEGVLRQRNALLRQVRGRLDADAAVTLDVWDEKLAHAGEQLRRAREDVVARLAARVPNVCAGIAGSTGQVELAYSSAWVSGELRNTLCEVRQEDLRRGATSVGPHRDDLVVSLHGQPARTHASQGEQRTLALALRLAVHEELATATGQWPLLLLDDVFSELDEERARGVLGALESEQTLLTTAGSLPPGIAHSALFRVADGRVVREA
ncbi:DNA replication/repair protein RecF [Candidatus Poriferisocius sp.]|uniref:DNA replication/repair protein RecF n=1 Tax=Candidatus Poriferisocius sp. TaxID=3101276 RepID=UPI003B58CF5A